MRNTSLWAGLLGIERAVVEDVELGVVEGVLVVHVRVRKGASRRCARCLARSPGYDRGEGRRRWRSLDFGTVRVELEAEAPRVRCAEHGVVVADVPWARHGAGHTYDFDETVAWLAVNASKSAVAQLMRIAWRTVGAIVSRVWADTEVLFDRFAGLHRIGIDEISFRRGHKYLTIVVDHDSGRLVWAQPGRDGETLREFFDALGSECSARITHVTADAAPWIATVVAERAPSAIVCADAFHVVAWATDALDETRRQAWNAASGRVRGARGTGNSSTGDARRLKGARYALWRNPEDLSGHQRDKLAWIAKTDPRLYRAYLLKEGLRHVFKVKGDAGKEALDRWLSWAQRCRIPAFVALRKKIVKYRAAIDAALDHNMSNALVESTNTKIRLIIRMAFGFADTDALVAMAMLSLGGHRPHLPGRT